MVVAAAVAVAVAAAEEAEGAPEEVVLEARGQDAYPDPLSRGLKKMKISVSRTIGGFV